MCFIFFLFRYICRTRLSTSSCAILRKFRWYSCSVVAVTPVKLFLHLKGKSDIFVGNRGVSRILLSIACVFTFIFLSTDNLSLLPALFLNISS